MRTELKRCTQSPRGAGIETRSRVDLQIPDLISIIIIIIIIIFDPW